MEFNGWDIYWIAWFLLGFGIPEVIALYRAAKYKTYGESLSENVREWFATDVRGWKDISAGAKWRRFFLFVGVAWLFAHWMIPNIF